MDIYPGDWLHVDIKKRIPVCVYLHYMCAYTECFELNDLIHGCQHTIVIILHQTVCQPGVLKLDFFSHRHSDLHDVKIFFTAVCHNLHLCTFISEEVDLSPVQFFL